MPPPHTQTGQFDQAAYQREAAALRGEDNVLLKSMGAMFANAIVFISIFRALHHLCDAKVRYCVFLSGFHAFEVTDPVSQLPSMIVGGTLWFPNLTLPDPLYALPLSMGVAMYLGAELLLIDSMANMDETQRAQSRMMMRVFSVVGPALMSTLPSGIQVYFLASSVATIAQGKVLNMPVRWLFECCPVRMIPDVVPQAVRTLLRLPPLGVTQSELNPPLPPTDGKNVVLMNGKYVPVLDQKPKVK